MVMRQTTGALARSRGATLACAIAFALAVCMLGARGVAAQDEDPCDWLLGETGTISGTWFPERCWRLRPLTGTYYEPLHVKFTFTDLSLTGGRLIIYEGWSLETRLLNINGTPVATPVTYELPGAKFLLHLKAADNINAVEVGFAVDFVASDERQYATSVLVLIGTTYALMWPIACLGLAKLCKSSDSEKFVKLQHERLGKMAGEQQSPHLPYGMYWLGMLIGVIMCTMALFRVAV